MQNCGVALGQGIRPFVPLRGGAFSSFWLGRCVARCQIASVGQLPEWFLVWLSALLVICIAIHIFLLDNGSLCGTLVGRQL